MTSGQMFEGDDRGNLFAPGGFLGSCRERKFRYQSKRLHCMFSYSDIEDITVIVNESARDVINNRPLISKEKSAPSMK